jgi:hypothetical protein
VQVLSLEGVLARPAEALQAVYRFVGVDPQAGLERAGVRYNANWTTVPRAWMQTPGLRWVGRAYVRVTEAALRRLVSDRETRRRVRTAIRTPVSMPARALPMPHAARERLAALYEPYIDRLEALLQRPFVEWRVAIRE